MITVLIADDHAMMREGLRNIINQSGKYTVIDEARNGKELLEKIHDVICDILIMDMSMPGPSGAELISQIRKLAPKLPILVLSMHNNWQVGAAAINSGANGYLTKDSDQQDLFDCIEKISSGKKFIPSFIAEKIRVCVVESLEANQHLSGRENQILQMIVEGKSNKNVAKELDLSPQTVSTHKKNIMEKINVANTAEMIRYFIERRTSDDKWSSSHQS